MVGEGRRLAKQGGAARTVGRVWATWVEQRAHQFEEPGSLDEFESFCSRVGMGRCVE